MIYRLPAASVAAFPGALSAALVRTAFAIGGCAARVGRNDALGRYLTNAIVRLVGDVNVAAGVHGYRMVIELRGGSRTAIPGKLKVAIAGKVRIVEPDTTRIRLFVTSPM